MRKPDRISAMTCPFGLGSALAAVFAFGLLPSALALRTEDRQLKGNGQIECLREPMVVEHFSEFFTRGTLHRRVRTNLFWWDWAEEKTSGGSQTRDNFMAGLGGSLIGRSARWHGWTGSFGFYSSQPLHSENTDPAVPLTNFGRSGKDTYRTRPNGSEAALNVLAEACVEYRYHTVSIRAGRQILDSLLLASNDSKMIPNTFEAASLEWRARAKTKFGATVVRREKLRDHSTFHSVIGYAKGSGNDDSGGHRGLTPQTLSAAGRDLEPPLVLITIEDRTVPHLKLAFDYVDLPRLFATAVADASYDFKSGAGWVVSSGLRLLCQWDRGGGAIGGASLTGLFARDRVFSESAADRLRLASYHHPSSLDGMLWAGRIGAARGPVAFSVAFSQVADRADIVAPWRGFPSGGYTRLMGQVDWLAGAFNRTLRVDYDLGKNRHLSTLTIAASCTREDFDERKVLAGSSLLTDRTVCLIDLVTELRALPRTVFKLRVGLIRADARPAVPVAVDYESYRDLRFEMNRLF